MATKELFVTTFEALSVKNKKRFEQGPACVERAKRGRLPLERPVP